MSRGNHKRIWEYEGAFKCLDCQAKWGALSGRPTMPEVCDTRMIVTLEEIKDIQAKRLRINDCDLSSIRFMENGKDVSIDEALVEEFEYTGLSNIDFITSGFYVDGFQPIDP